MNHERIKVMVRGAVQGVGFRPFVYRLASELRLRGWVCNSAQGVCIEAEGERPRLTDFLRRLDLERPPRSLVQSLESSFLDPAGYDDFEIRESNGHDAKRTLILPDLATCADCRHEIFDPNNRRYLYPFTNCTNCGPRFSIIESLPYDRPNTSMKRFVMCPDCEQEYRDPANRRFHAQPNACPACGPQLELWDAAGRIAGQRTDALFGAIRELRLGRILALKGIGGFQLLVDARNEEAVRRLRARKQREAKPLAVMFPSLEATRTACHINDAEERLLCSPEAPIVLLERQAWSDSVAVSVAPRNRHLGVMLPYSPLHHILLWQLGFPVVATSGNRSDEPICIEEHDAAERLRGIADAFLVHNRPIVRHVDDSVTRVLLGREQILRRARGYAPLPISLKSESANPDFAPILAVGAHLKNSVALSVGNDVFLSQHIGDLETPQALEAFRRVVTDFQRLYEAVPTVVACDAHPEYLSTKHAAELGVPLKSVQHHVAHVLSCMADNALEPPVLGVSWDGTGYGLDGTIWGGEFFLAEEQAVRRVAHLRAFPLPGGEAAIKQPRRTALGLLYELLGDAAFERRDLQPIADFSPNELLLLRQAMARGVNAPMTSSAGRLFDAVAALLGLCQRVSFEGQAAMELEFIAQPEAEGAYPFELTEATPAVVNWQPMILEILAELQRGESVATIAAKFHNTLVEIIVAVAQRMQTENIALCGGCFQNRYLTERSVQRLRAEGFHPYWHQRVPPNDGGIALGQIAAVQREANSGVAPPGPMSRELLNV